MLGRGLGFLSITNKYKGKMVGKLSVIGERL